jgi:hypothetical protein
VPGPEFKPPYHQKKMFSDLLTFIRWALNGYVSREKLRKENVYKDLLFT